MAFKNPADRIAYNRRYTIENCEALRQKRLVYYAENKQKILAAGRANRLKNQPRERANWKLRFAIRAGWIKRDAPEFHHPDYDRPYYGCWVTSAQHRQIHAGIIECPPCTDYSKQVEECRERATWERNSKGGIAGNKVRWGSASPNQVLGSAKGDASQPKGAE